MLEKIYYNEINLNDEGTLQWILQRVTLLIKKKLLGREEYLVIDLSIKSVTNNGVTRWDDFEEIKAQKKKKRFEDLFDLTVTGLKQKKIQTVE